MKRTIIIFLLAIGFNNFAQNSLQLAIILKQLNLNLEQCKQEFISSKILPNNPEETIYVIPELVEEFDFGFSLNSYILIVDTKTGKIKYKYFESYETNGWSSDAVVLSEIIIDTAPYNLAQGKRAFGVRVKHTGSSKPNPYYSETISLFIVETDSMSQILKNFTTNEYNGEWDLNCEGESLEQNNILIITKNMTKGYYDILIQNKVTERKSSFDKDAECIESESLSTKKQVLKFENGKYK